MHKSTHHFDLLNWWLGDTPVSVAAKGTRAFYTPEMAAELGLAGHAPRCQDCPCPATSGSTSRADPALRALYLEAEDEDGYLRDRCVFDADIDIEDTMQVLVGYASGASATYTLCAYAPWEGLEITFLGTRGELTAPARRGARRLRRRARPDEPRQHGDGAARRRPGARADRRLARRRATTAAPTR